ncbi:hypothetical protein HH308_06275 [Gordonia sp. TBRC 11910]|uniref:2'-5' RNA ligase superfamily protein n=1 Tax=Gordonia asplenii TaxID=2725283 RepID=A0A848KZE2_9ACTN|nr:hypothetical protein [Gordonia asplenii]
MRPLPLPLSAQRELSEGHDGSTTIGLMERVWLEDGMVWAEGRLDLADPAGQEWARKLADGFASWCSVDLSGQAGLRVEEVPYDADGHVMTPEAMAQLSDDQASSVSTRMHVSNWKVMGVTLVSSPAFESARIEPVYDYQSTLTAAADDGEGQEHTGGMVALLPSQQDQERLAVAGGDEPDQLHTTLAFLGDDVTGMSPDEQRAILDAVTPLAQNALPGKVFGTAEFNPDDNQCAVYIAQADGLTELRNQIVQALGGVMELPEQHDSYIPHITAGYGMDVGKLGEPGPITYDRLRVAIAGNAIDIPLSDAVTAALTAAGIVYSAADFADPGLDQPTKLTITDDGRVFGHLATWGTCHTGIRDVCITAPSSPTNYSYFHQGRVLTDSGEVEVGKITLGTGHAPTAGVGYRAALAHYDHSGSAVAVIRAGEDAYGIWVAGHMLPSATDEQVDTLRRCPLSGDWRQVNRGPLELVAALAVNVPGFPIPNAVAASGALVAAGVVNAPRRIVDEVTRMTDTVLAAQQRAQRITSSRDRITKAATMTAERRFAAARARIYRKAS